MLNLGDYEGALEIFKRVYGEDHPQYASTLGNLSSVMLNLGDYKGSK
jgi:hypothetical protein